MREYGKTKSVNWISPRLSGYARIIAAYLFGGPHCNWIGCFNCPPHYAVADTGLPLSRVRKAYAELVAEGVIKSYRNMICLINFFSIEKVDNPNVATARFKEFLQLPAGEHRVFVAEEMLIHFGQHLNEEQKSQLVDLTVVERLGEPLPERLGEPSANLSPNRDRDRDIYKSKAQQQQLSGARVNAAPPTTPVEDGPAEKISTPPKPKPPSDAEPANGNLPTAELPTASKATPDPADPADPLPETPHHPAPPEPHTAPAEPVSADPADATVIDIAVLWEQFTPQQRRELLEQAGAADADAAVTAQWDQFSAVGQRKLLHVLQAMGFHLLYRDGPTDDAGAPSEPLPRPEPPEMVIESPLADENGGEKGIIHADTDNAKNDDLETVSANPVVTDPVPTRDLAHLRAMGVPESIDLAVWQHFEQMAQAKVRWSSATGSTLARQLRHAIADGADGNALLEWVTVRGLLDLPDAWQRMQADAAKAARQREGHAAETVTGTVSEGVSQTVTGTVSEGVSQTVTGTPTGTVSEEVSQTVAGTPASDKPNHPPEKHDKGKKKKEKREARKPDDVSDETWADFVEHRKNRKSLVTERVIEMFRKQAHKAGISLDEAMQISVTRGWIGFEAEWLESAKNKRMHHAGHMAAHLMPNASGRLPGESAADFSLRLYLEDQQKMATNSDTPAIGLFNDSPTPALMITHGDTTE